MTTEKIYCNLLAQLDRLFRHNRQGSFKTRERYKESMKRFCRFLSETYRLERLANIGPKHILAYAAFMKARGLAASTIKTDLAGIRFFHDQMPNIRYVLPANDTLDLERRSFGIIDRTWSNAEFARMIAVCWNHKREDYAAIVCLARYAGLRIHECFRIDTAAAEKAVKTLEISVKGKGGKIRTVPIQDSIRIELEKMLAVTKKGDKLFVPAGMPTHTAIKRLQQFIILHREALRDTDSGSPLTFHGLRHTCAAEWYMSLKTRGYTEPQARKQVSLWLGHERDDVTRLYLASVLKDGGHSE